MSPPATARGAAPLELKACFRDPAQQVMNFLNEVVLRYPQAVSFAPGRPVEHLFDVAGTAAYLERWVGDEARRRGVPPRRIYEGLGQYGRTNGIIRPAVARHLELDEGIRVAPEAVMVTVGCQEAMAVLLLGLFDPAADVLLASDPTYIGITGLAGVMGLPVHPVPSGDDGLEVGAVAAAIDAVRAAGRRPRAFYHIPDFNNPLGTRMPLAARRELLELAGEAGILLFEDNPYGMFCYQGERLPTLKALDEAGVVVYLGSFAKTLFPGLRVGYLVADQRVASPQGGRRLLAEELSMVKSLTTVNTPPMVQAMIGGVLAAEGGSLAAAVERKLPFYRANRDRMVARLEERFGGVEGVTWNRPEGGFFLTVGLPFDFGEAELTTCAGDYGVICCPMSFFTLVGGRERQVRLSFSYVTPDEIDEGVDRFARFVGERLAAAPAATR